MSFKFGETDWSDPLPRQKLRKLWALGLSASEIGRHFSPHLSKNAILGASRRLCLPPRASPTIKVGEKRPPRRSPRPKPDDLKVQSGEPEVPAAPPLDIEKRGPGLAVVRRTLPTAPPAPEPAAIPRPSHPCLWPMWGDCRAPMPPVFCNAPGAPGRPYCPEHCSIAFVPASGRIHVP